MHNNKAVVLLLSLVFTTYILVICSSFLFILSKPILPLPGLIKDIIMKLLNTLVFPAENKQLLNAFVSKRIYSKASTSKLSLSSVTLITQPNSSSACRTSGKRIAQCPKPSKSLPTRSANGSPVDNKLASVAFVFI